ncbi:hypothetical protein SEA_BEUFFERT_32 [Streptomyces phage Beuffert]|nr:hypothetical protein SEA_BEUFFERT_32 [Streptomyces phage Beuffert]
MAAGRKFLGFNVDTSEGAALSGFLKELSLKIGTPRHIGPVLKYTHALMSQEFTDYMAVVAAAQTSRFHHVYEWGQVGDPTAKLWDDKLIGGGNNRTATFTWRASKQLVLVSQEAQDVGVKQIHVFAWKAPVMEYGKNITIEPKRGEYLSLFTGPTKQGGKWKLRVFKGPVTVTNPGGKMTKGSFTREYVSWWGGTGAQGVFESKVKKVLEEDLGRMPIESVTKQFRRANTKTFKMSTIGEAEAAEKAGRAAAQKYLNGRSNNYIQAARARERIIYG